MNKIKSFLLLSLFAALFLFSAVDANAQLNPDWYRPYKPFRIAGNLYYVGTYDLACYLITTPSGHILINAAMDSTVPLLRKNVEELGFKLNDIKILLSSQGHFDHVGGMATIQKMTGAKVMIDEKDVPVMADGGNSDYLMGGKGSMFKPVKVDRSLKDKDIIELDDMKLTFLHQPGHTKGASGYLFTVKDDKRSYIVHIANMPTILDGTKPGMKTYPNVKEDFAYTFRVLKQQKFDIWLAAHTDQFNLFKKHKEGEGYNPAAFIDQKGYDKKLSELEQVYYKKLGK